MLNARQRETVRALLTSAGSRLSLATLSERVVEAGIYASSPPNEGELTWDIRAALKEPDANGVPCAVDTTCTLLPQPYRGRPSREKVRRKLRLVMTYPWLREGLSLGEVVLLDPGIARTYARWNLRRCQTLIPDTARWMLGIAGSPEKLDQRLADMGDDPLAAELRRYLADLQQQKTAPQREQTTRDAPVAEREDQTPHGLIDVTRTAPSDIVAEDDTQPHRDRGATGTAAPSSRPGLVVVGSPRPLSETVEHADARSRVPAADAGDRE